MLLFYLHLRHSRARAGRIRRIRGLQQTSQILFFERTKTGNKITKIEINDKGGLSSDQPRTYRDFFMKEEIDLLGL